MSLTSKFIQAFDARNQAHVQWLSNMVDLAEKMGDPNRPIMLVEEINKNPMKIKMDSNEALEWPHIHFCIMAVYAKAVMRKRAWLPVE
jgi:LPS O-antigen subunit length determinant protein (WzzB/FepE family)